MKQRLQQQEESTPHKFYHDNDERTMPGTDE
jgi:hypothetical protein